LNSPKLASGIPLLFLHPGVPLKEAHMTGSQSILGRIYSSYQRIHRVPEFLSSLRIGKGRSSSSASWLDLDYRKLHRRRSL